MYIADTLHSSQQISLSLTHRHTQTQPHTHHYCLRSEDNSQIKLTRLQEKGFKDGSLYFLNIRIPCVFLTSERSSGFKFSWVFVA